MAYHREDGDTVTVTSADPTSFNYGPTGTVTVIPTLGPMGVDLGGYAVTKAYVDYYISLNSQVAGGAYDGGVVY